MRAAKTLPLLMFSLLALATSVWATGESRIRGQVTAADPTAHTVTVLGVTVLLAPSTATSSDIALSETPSPPPIVPGVFVEVTGIWDGSQLAAETVRVQAPAASMVRGVIAAIDTAEQRVTIDGVVVQVTPQTQLRVAGQATTFDTFAVGQGAEARGTWVAPRLMAAELSRDASGHVEEIECRGPIESIDPVRPSVTVSGEVCVVVRSTAILNNLNRPIPFSALEVGQFVAAEGVRGSSGDVIARVIRVEDGPDEETEIRRRGPLVAIEASGSIFVVGGTRFHITAETELVGRGDVEIPVTAFHVGDLVEAEGVRDFSGDVVARRVERENPEHQSGIEGVITAVDAVAQTVVIRDLTVVITDATVLRKADGTEATFADLTVGSRAAAHGRVQEDGTLLAAAVHLLPVAPAHHDRVCGRITAADASAQTLVLDETTVQVTPTTRLLDAVGRPVSFEAFAVGRRACAVGDFGSGGVLTAIQVRLVDSIGEGGQGQHIRFAGPVTSVSASDLSFDVGPRHVLTDEETAFRFRDGSDAAFGDLAVGLIVEVEGARQADGILAVEVKILGEPPDPTNAIRLRGSIEAIDASAETLTVRGIVFSVLPATVIEGRHHNPLTLADLNVGDLVQVWGIRTGEDTADAHRIALDDANEPPRNGHPVHFAGSIEEIVDDSTLVVAGRTVHVTASTEIRAFDEIDLTFADLQVGEPVAVAGLRLEDGSVLARMIRQEIAIITAIDASTEHIIVNDLDVAVLPTTEIEYASGEAATFADLTVGQTVRLQAELDGSQIVAREIRILSPMVLTGLPGYAPLQLQFIDGRAAVTVDRRQASCGFVYDCDTPAEIQPGSMTILTMTISCNQPNPALVPQFRVRIGTQNFMRAAFINVLPIGSQTITAGLEPKRYQIALAPPEDAAEGNPRSNGLYFSFDAFDFQPESWEPPVTFTIHAIDIDTVPLANVQTSEVIASWDFADSSEGWVFETVTSPWFTAPVASCREGGLSLSAPDQSTFGFWTMIQSGLSIQPGSLLRLRATLSTTSADSAHLPVLRMRLADKAFEQIGEFVITPNGASRSLPSAEGQTYDLYYRWPDYAPVMDEMVLNYDLINLTESGTPGVPIVLEDVSLETVQIVP